MKQDKFKLTHTTLYAKGWYKKSDNVWDDLMEILKLDDYTPFSKGDVYNILLNNVQRYDSRWTDLREVMIGIHPNECWKYGYYVKNNANWSNGKSVNELPDYDMPTAFIKYVLSNLRDLDRNQWNPSVPKWTKYPKKSNLTISDVYNMFIKKK